MGARFGANISGMPFTMMKAKIWLLCAFVALADIGSARAIVDGDVDAAPFADRVAMILTRGPEGSGFCTGIVLSKLVLLTAGHCLRPAADMLVHFRDRGGEPVLIEVSATARNPGFQANAVARQVRSLDLGLIRVKTPLPETFQPATLSGEAPPPGASLRAIGFGLAVEGVAKSGGVLRGARLRVREPKSAVLLWLEGEQAPAGACSGDSGGPVMDGDGSVAAVIAWAAGAPKSHCGKLTQAVLVAPVRAWIDETLANWR